MDLNKRYLCRDMMTPLRWEGDWVLHKHTHTQTLTFYSVLLMFYSGLHWRSTATCVAAYSHNKWCTSTVWQNFTLWHFWPNGKEYSFEIHSEHRLRIAVSVPSTVDLWKADFKIRIEIACKHTETNNTPGHTRTHTHTYKHTTLHTHTLHIRKASTVLKVLLK